MISWVFFYVPYVWHSRYKPQKWNTPASLLLWERADMHEGREKEVMSLYVTTALFLYLRAPGQSYFMT